MDDNGVNKSEDDSEEGPDGGYGWVIAISSTILQGICLGMSLTMGVFMPMWLDTFNMGASVTSWAISLKTSLLFGTGPFVSVLVLRYGHRNICLCGILLSTIGTFGSGFATNIYVLYLMHGIIAGSKMSYFSTINHLISKNECVYIQMKNITCIRSERAVRDFKESEIYLEDRIKFTIYHMSICLFCERMEIAFLISGIGYGLMYLPPCVIVGEYFTKLRPLIMPLTTIGPSLFGLIMPYIFHSLLDSFGWRGAMIISSGLVLQSAVCGALLRPSNSKPDNLQELKNQLKFCDSSLLSNVTFWTFSVNNMLYHMTCLIMYVFIVDFAINSGIDNANSAYLLIYIGAGNNVGRLLVLPLTKYYHALSVYNASTVLLIITTGCIPLAKTLSYLIVLSCLFGVGVGLQLGSFIVVVTNLFGIKKLTRAYGLVLVFQGLGSSIGPLIGGVLYDVTGSYTSMFYLAAALSSIAVIMMLVVQCKKHTQSKRTGPCANAERVPT